MVSSYAQFATEFPWFFPALSFVFGAIVGSFLNVCIYRIPLGKSVVRPGSHCACGMLFIAVLVVATFVDLDHFITPDSCTIGAAVAGLLLSFAVPSLHGQHANVFLFASLHSGFIALEGLLIGSALVLWIALLAEVILKKEAMGFGDVKFLGAIGAFCGWQGALFSIFGGAVIGTVWPLLAMLGNKLHPVTSQAPTQSSSDSEAKAENGHDALLNPSLGALVPFGPMLATGAAVYFFLLQPIVHAYFSAPPPFPSCSSLS